MRLPNDEHTLEALSRELKGKKLLGPVSWLHLTGLQPPYFACLIPAIKSLVAGGLYSP